MQTRYTKQTGIILDKIEVSRSKTLWSHFDTNDNQHNAVGPKYNTKAEALADHADYIVRSGWIRQADIA